ncbi:DUF4173 domain-containing protein [Stakelama sediminis]|uniref:DUF4173 domain-containing protein n=1 Tax=Stakelama sediminis TaxID=463200 RepID=A0A840Z0N4_9SPHN|nr:DUF4173 domain-containing protein [Stakelama sediminis]MBB5719463.1 hypothetical protein [Stakelama sediminis]
MQLSRQSAGRGTFLMRIAGAALLVALADWFFYGAWAGATLGGFAFAWIAAMLLLNPAVRRQRQPRIAIGGALLFAGVLVDAPGLLSWALFWTALACAVLLVRHRFDNAADWMIRLFLHVVTGLVSPIRDLIRIGPVQRRAGAPQLVAILSVLALPLLGGALFIALFAGANPLIAHALSAIRLPGLDTALYHLMFWALIAVMVWPSLRSSRLATGIARWHWPFAGARITTVPAGSVLLSLITFNGLFAVENILDIVFLWSGAPLPGNVTMADYAHRGAYSLIATALLAALFVLVALRPGSESARTPLIRRLVVLWIAQNLLLVASSILRTLDYVTAYGMTEWRIAALLWMGLVATGLILICRRLIAGLSTRWLINANVLAAVIVLSGSSIVSLGGIAAAWNVRHSRIGGTGSTPIDLCYMHRLGAAALIPLIRLEPRVKDAAMRDRITYLRSDIMQQLRATQADWHQWTWRDARRLSTAEKLLGTRPAMAATAPDGRDCDATIRKPQVPEPVVQAASPLTNGSGQ